MEITIDDTDKKIIRRLAEDFPLVAEPYKQMATEIGIGEDEFLWRIGRMIDEKKIRKMGAVLRHGQVGYAANGLCAWEVPAERIEKVAQNMSRHPAVSHCYERVTLPEWRYNLYTMIHAHSRDECEAVAAELGAANGISTRQMLYSVKEWKKAGLKYFAE